MFKVAYDHSYTHPLPVGHRFPMIKYSVLHQQLIHHGICTKQNFFQPTIADKTIILDTHKSTYYNKLLNLDLDQKEIRKTGFPLSAQLVEREMLIAGGTVMATEHALNDGISLNIAGGTHHAYTDRGEAFCLLNDQAIGARYLTKHKNIDKVLIIDLDVHQGNGTAKIFEDDERVFTFSMHGKNNYPFKKENSDLDIDLDDGTDDATYLNILEDVLPKLITQESPDFIYYLCGVDILASDKLGKLAMTIKGSYKRDLYVLSTCVNHKIPVMCSMGGGYSPDVKDVVNAHSNTFEIARDLYG